MPNDNNSLEHAPTDIPFRPSTIENIDFAMFEWLRDQMMIHTTTFQGWKEIPVLWVSAERSVQIKKDKGLRDADGALILPILTLERSGLVKDLKRKGSVQAHLPEKQDYKGGVGGQITIAKRVNPKTNDFANAVSGRKFSGVGTGAVNFNTRGRRTEKVVYDIYSMPTPVYVTAKYDINIRTEYQAQMNEILTPLIVYTGGVNQFILKRDGHRYEAFISQDFNFKNNVSSMGEEERSYESTITVEVLGYIFGQGANRSTPYFARRENAVEVRLPRERVMMGDIPDWLDRAFFRGGEVLTPTHVSKKVDGPSRVPLMPSPRGASSTGGGGDGQKIGIYDESNELTNDVATLDFQGAGVTATVSGQDVTITVADGVSVPVKDEGSQITAAVTSFDFVGTGITATAADGDVTVTVNASAISGSDEGVEVASSVDSLDFTGPNVVATAVGGALTIDITGSYVAANDEGSTLTGDMTSIDFVGPGVTATESSGAVTVTISGSLNGVNLNDAIVNNTTYNEVPTGNINGVNMVYSLSVDALTDSIMVFHNGVLLRLGGTFDYTVTGDAEVTFTYAPTAGDHILVTYVHKTVT